MVDGREGHGLKQQTNSKRVIKKKKKRPSYKELSSFPNAWCLLLRQASGISRRKKPFSGLLSNFSLELQNFGVGKLLKPSSLTPVRAKVPYMPAEWCPEPPLLRTSNLVSG